MVIILDVHESVTKEFKRDYTDDLKKTVVAFANTDGGEIWIGVEDDGSLSGLDKPDDTIRQVTCSIRDNIKPDLSMHTRIDIRTIEDKQIVVVEVQRGTACPYYLVGKGIRPEGVYIRQGASSVPATESLILKMIKETGESFESSRSLNQELTFMQSQRFFEDEHIKFGQEQKRSLGLIDSNGTWTNLGLLLSDQCGHTIKAAVFEGDSKITFKDRAEFPGSLLKQVEDTYRYLDQFNHTRSTLSGLKRIDYRSYPPDAIREALLNAVVHRDYSYSGSILISVFDNRIEFVSLGGLPKGISYNDLLLGISEPRNIQLANIFYRLHLIEAYGTGVPKIMDHYLEYDKKPTIEISDNAFKIMLPNMNEQRLESEHPVVLLTPDEQTILNLLRDRENLVRAEIESATGFSQAKSIRVINQLISKGELVKIGKGKRTHYRLAKGSGASLN